MKNILSDTDYIKGWDNRFGVAVVVGKVTKIECSDKAANVRVLLPDRVDHQEQPLITKPIPVLQMASLAKKSFAIPRLNDNVVLVKLPNGTSNYMVIGSFYTSKDPPPVTDPKLDYTEWEGGHIQKFDANDGADVFLTQDFKGGWKATVKKDIDIKTTDGGKVSIEGDGDVLMKSATGNINVESPTGTVTIKQQTIELQAAEIKLTGLVTINGAMNQTGIHQDSNGFHVSGAERIAELERRVAALESVILNSGQRGESHG
jgi:phage baseplate assembly protein gpV